VAEGPIATAWIELRARSTQLSRDIEEQVAAVGDPAAKAMDESMEKVRASVDDTAEHITHSLSAGAEDAAVNITSSGATIGKTMGKTADDVESAGGRMGKATKDVADEGSKLGGAFDKGTTVAGGALSKLGNLAAGLGLPFSQSFTKIGDGFTHAEAEGGKFSQVMESLGKVVAVAGVAGFAVAAGESINLANKYQAATTSLAATAGISNKAATAIGTTFLDTAGKSIYSAKTIMTAYAPVSAQLAQISGHALNSAQAMKVMAAAQDLAEGSGTDLGAATGALASVMQTYGMSVGQASGASDVLFNAARLTNTSITTVAQAVDRLKARLGIAAPTLDDTGALMDELAQHGISGSKGVSMVSTALTSLLAGAAKSQASTVVLTNAQSALKAAYDQLPPSLIPLAKQLEAGTLTSAQYSAATKGMTLSQVAAIGQFKSTTDAVGKAKLALDTVKLTPAQAEFQKLGLSVYTAGGKFVGMQSLIAQLGPKLQGMTQEQQALTEKTLFGASAGAVMGQVMLSGVAKYDKSRAAVAAVGAAHEAAEKQSQTFSHTLELLESTAEDLATKFGIILIPYIKDLANDIASATRFFEKHTDVAKALALVIGGVLASAVIMFATQAVGEMVEGVVKAIGSMVGLGGASEAAAATVEVSGETIATTAEVTGEAVETAFGPWGLLFAGISIAVILLMHHWKEIWGEIQDIAETVANAVEGFLTSSWNEIQSVTSTVFDWIETFLRNWGPLILGIMTGGVGNLVLLVIQNWTTIKNTTVSIFDDVLHFLEQWGPYMLGALGGPIGLAVVYVIEHWTQVKTFTVNIWDSILAFFNTVWSSIVSVFASFFSTIWNAVNASWTRVLNFFKTIWNAILTAVELVWTTLSGWLASAWQAFENVATNLWSNIVNAIGAIWHGWYTANVDIANLLNKALSAIWQTFETTAGNYWRRIVGAITGAWGSLVTDADDLWDKIKASFVSGIDDVIDVINKVFLKPIGSVLGLVGVHMGTIPLIGAAAGTKIGGGFATNKPTILTGEGRSKYPEFVIPSDPQYAPQAQALLGQAAQRIIGMASGGVIPGGRAGALGDPNGGGSGGGLSGLLGGIASIGGEVGHLLERAASHLASGTIDPLLNKTKSLVDPLVGRIPPPIIGQTGVGLVNTTVADIKNLISGIGGGGGTMGSSLQWPALYADAMKWLGVPYSFGGTTMAGVDCSGLVQALYHEIGIQLGRSTVQQITEGSLVGTPYNWAASMPLLMPGDAIFYQEPGASGAAAHEVMYIGGGRVIQAPHTGTDVQISPLFGSASSDEPFAEIRRYLAAAGSSAGAGLTGSLAALPYGSVEQYWRNAGGPAAIANVMAAVSTAESGRIPGKVQPDEPPGETGWGLWQITPTSGMPGPYSQYLNPATNAMAAVRLASPFTSGQLASQWTTYRDGAYLPFLQAAASGGILSSMHKGIYDTGGFLPEGWSLAGNFSGAPEAVPNPQSTPASSVGVTAPVNVYLTAASSDPAAMGMQVGQGASAILRQRQVAATIAASTRGR
jgi:NlpC/P60 family